MDIPRLSALNSYWSKHPPLHLMVASYFGFKPQPLPTALATNNSEQDLEAFMQMFSAAGGAMG